MAVTPETIATALGQAAPPLASPTYGQWSMWIADALMLIQVRETEMGKTADPTRIDYVVREAVVAQVKRPDDSTQLTVSVDDGQTSKSWRSGKGRVTIIDEWWTLLGLTDPDGAFSIDLLPADYQFGAW